MKLVSRILSLCLLLSVLPAIHAEWRNCPFGEHEAEEVFNVFFEYFKKVDPGDQKLIDPKGCKIDVDCSAKGDAIHARFKAECIVLTYKPKAKNHMKPNGEKFKLQKTVVSGKNSDPYLKE